GGPQEPCEGRRLHGRRARRAAQGRAGRRQARAGEDLQRPLGQVRPGGRRQHRAARPSRGERLRVRVPDGEHEPQARPRDRDAVHDDRRGLLLHLEPLRARRGSARRRRGRAGAPERARGAAPEVRTAAGSAELREAISDWMHAEVGQRYAVAQIICTAGAKQALYNACQALLDEGDEAVIPNPYWVSYPDIVRLAGATPVDMVTRAED